MQPFNSTCSFSAEIPYSNTFNTRCDICSHPISQSDINILQPCCCGPFHGYCITNLELQTRDSDPTNSNPQLTCPRCRQTVSAVNYDFSYDRPQASRPPFAAPIQPTTQPVLPTAIHDTCPVRPNAPRDLPSYPLYPQPTPPFHPPPPPTDFTPSAPPAPRHETSLQMDINEAFPPPEQKFNPQTPNHVQPSFQPAPSFQRRHESNVSHDSSTSHPSKIVHLPSPYDGVPISPPTANTQPQNRSHSHHSRSSKNSPNTVVICRQVNEDDVRKGIYGDDVYKAYVEGKATVLDSADLSKPHKGHGKGVNVKVEMDLHVYHHYKPPVRSAKEKARRKVKPADKTWWKSPRSASRLDSREETHIDERYRARNGPSRRS